MRFSDFYYKTTCSYICTAIYVCLFKFVLQSFLGNGGCPGFPCYNGGTCFTNDSGSRCLCTAGYNGVHCEGTI